MKLYEKYLVEGLTVEKAKKEIKELKRIGKLTSLGQKRLNFLLNYLYQKGIFDI